MESHYEQLLSLSILLKFATLIAWYLIGKIFLKVTKLVLPIFVRKNRLRYHIQDILSLIFGTTLVILSAILFANELKEFAIPFSVIGAGIAFALQEAIGSIAGRIVVVTTGLYQVGDRIQVGEVQGDVINIGFMRTSLMEIGKWVKADQYSGRIIHLTNSLVLKDNVINYSGSFPYLWDEIVIPVKYGSDQHLARKILLDITEKNVNQFIAEATQKWKDLQKLYMVETPDFGAVITLVANDNWLEFNIRYLVPYNKRRTVKDALFLNIVDAFEQNKGKVEFASMTIDITNFPKVGVHLENV